MEKIQIKIKKLDPKAVIPTKAHTTDAGCDLTAISRVFAADGTATYGTGLAIEIPEGYVGLLFPRSSVYRVDQHLTNCVGVIDSGYRGEIKFKFKPTLVYADKDGIGEEATEPWQYEGTDQTDPDTQEVTFNGRQDMYPDLNEGCMPFPFRAYEIGERIGQIIIMPYPEVEYEVADTLSDSDRGTTGYGDSGK